MGKGDGLAARRRAELQAAADDIGAAALHFLGYADSGLAGPEGGTDGTHPMAFAHADVDRAAARLAEVLVGEQADVLTIYDPAGGYGHPDHIQVHRVGTRAAELAGTPVVLEATVDRDGLVAVLRRLQRAGILALLSRAGVNVDDWKPDRYSAAYAEPARITHAVDVRRYCPAKRAAMAAHVSQSLGEDGTTRALGVFLRLPGPLFRRVFGTEWFVQQGRAPSATRLDDIFDTIRSAPRP